MSKIKLEGNATGSGTLTISAPATNTDRSLTLPDGAGEILTDASTLSSSNLSGALPAIDGSALTGIVSGLTGADGYRLSANFSGGNDQVINNYWERVDYGLFNKLGTGLTESGGVFTFPETGYWFIHWFSSAQNDASYKKNGVALEYTNNGGTGWDTVGQYIGYTYHGNEPHAGSQSHIVDITDTSNDKIRFSCNTSATSTLYYGDSYVSYTGFNAFRLGDT